MFYPIIYVGKEHRQSNTFLYTAATITAGAWLASQAQKTSNTIMPYKNKNSSAVTNKLEDYRPILSNKKAKNRKS